MPCDGKTVNFYDWNPVDNSLRKRPMEETFKTLAISNYQIDDELYHNGGLQLKDLNE